MVTGQINVREYRRPKGQSKKDNPEELTTMVTGQINGGEFRSGNQKRTIQRNRQQWSQDK
jgi:hypothetical protein